MTNADPIPLTQEQDSARLGWALRQMSTTLPIPAGIPTDNPMEALHFCQHLASLLEPDQALTADPISAPVPPRPGLSVVIPVYNEEENIPVLHDRLTKALKEMEQDYELLFVDDGSHDRSARMLSELAEQDPFVKCIELTRNFGHQVAVSAGLDYAQGDAVIVMDADLQDPPEELPRLIEKWRAGYDVVYAIRQQRKEGWLKRGAYATFYRSLHWITKIDIPLDAGDFCIMDRRVVDVICSLPERNRFVRGIRTWVGFRQIGIPYEREARQAGKPKYTLGRLMLLALDGFVSFSHTPLRIASLLGLSISVFTLLLAIFYIIKKMTTGLNPPGFATLIVSILFFAGVQLITIGIMGEYVGRIFDEVKRRPLYVVRKASPSAGPPRATMR